MILKRASLFFLACVLLLGMAAQAQQIDLAFGVSTVSSASSGDVSAGNFSPQTIGGGAYPAFSGDFLIKHNLGVSGNVAWRASQNLYFGYQPFRPIFYDFNGIWVPPLGKHASAELMAGIGAESVRFYQPTYICSYTGCTNYTSSNHFLGHFGGGLRLYVTNHIFVRPEAHVYLIHNNYEFSSGHATRYGLSIGYSFRSE